MEVLERISAQLSSFSTNAAFINSTVPPIPGPAFQATTTNVAINLLWFLSLTLALMAALFAILAQQWLRHYADLALVTARDRARIRQSRFDALGRWGVPQAIMGLAVLLQAALFLFFAGLVVLLWTADGTVALAVTVTVGFFLAAFLATTAIPTVSTRCPYKSPLARAFKMLTSSVAHPVVDLVHREPSRARSPWSALTQRPQGTYSC